MVGQALVVQRRRSDRPATQFRFRYDTDGGYNEAGAFLDDIVVKVAQGVVFNDGAESGARLDHRRLEGFHGHRGDRG